MLGVLRVRLLCRQQVAVDSFWAECPRRQDGNDGRVKATGQAEDNAGRASGLDVASDEGLNDGGPVGGSVQIGWAVVWELHEATKKRAVLAVPVKAVLVAASAALGDVDANVEMVVASAKEHRDADLLVFPELHLTGYNLGDDVQRLAFGDGDDRLEPLHRVAEETRTMVVAGAPRVSRPGVYHNSAGLWSPDGSLQWYDKRALATFTTFREGLFFQPGTESPVWQTEFGGLAPSICYDAYFPEFSRAQALQGADVLVNISASPATTRRFFQVVLPARAVENACFQLYSNVCGAQDGVVFWGGSHAWGPRGDLLAEVPRHQEGEVVVKLQLDDLHAARQFRPTLRDASADDLEDLARVSAQAWP